jgi:hypothetical protein
MRYQDFLNTIVEYSLPLVENFYKDNKAALEGARAGLLACRDRTPPQLALLLARVENVRTLALHNTLVNRYFRLASYSSEVEWICNVVSAALVSMGMDPIIPSTNRGFAMAARIIEMNKQKESN